MFKYVQNGAGLQYYGGQGTETAEGFCHICNLQLKEIEKDCPLCMSSLMTFVKKIILIKFYRKGQIPGLFFKLISIFFFSFILL